MLSGANLERSGYRRGVPTGEETVSKVTNPKEVVSQMLREENVKESDQ